MRRGMVEGTAEGELFRFRLAIERLNLGTNRVAGVDGRASLACAGAAMRAEYAFVVARHRAAGSVVIPVTPLVFAAAGSHD
jgi:hypothetical protein